MDLVPANIINNPLVYFHSGIVLHYRMKGFLPAPLLFALVVPFNFEENDRFFFFLSDGGSVNPKPHLFLLRARYI